MSASPETKVQVIEALDHHAVILQPVGRFDTKDHVKVMADAIAAVEANPRYHFDHLRLVIELDTIDFLASAYLRVCVTALKARYRAGGDLVIAAPNGLADAVLDMTGLDNIFPTYHSLLEALNAPIVEINF